MRPIEIVCNHAVLGAVFVVGIEWDLWRFYTITHDGRLIFGGGLLALVYLAAALQTMTTVPRRDL